MGERAVSFLDVAERPPVFQQLPRGAVVAKKKVEAVGCAEGEDRIRREQNAMEEMEKNLAGLNSDLEYDSYCRVKWVDFIHVATLLYH